MKRIEELNNKIELLKKQILEAENSPLAQTDPQKNDENLKDLKKELESAEAKLQIENIISGQDKTYEQIGNKLNELRLKMEGMNSNSSRNHDNNTSNSDNDAPAKKTGILDGWSMTKIAVATTAAVVIPVVSSIVYNKYKS